MNPRISLHNAAILHKKIDVSKLRRIEDDTLAAADGLQARFDRYRTRIDAGKELHQQAIHQARQTFHPYIYLPFAEIVAISADDLHEVGIDPTLIERAEIEFASAAAIYADYQRQAATVGNARKLLDGLQRFAERVPG